MAGTKQSGWSMARDDGVWSWRAWDADGWSETGSDEDEGTAREAARKSLADHQGAGDG